MNFLAPKLERWSKKQNSSFPRKLPQNLYYFHLTTIQFYAEKYYKSELLKKSPYLLSASLHRKPYTAPSPPYSLINS